MFEHYGYSGTMLPNGAMVLQCLIIASLFRPQTFYINIGKKHKSRQRETDASMNGCFFFFFVVVFFVVFFFFVLFCFFFFLMSNYCSKWK